MFLFRWALPVGTNAVMAVLWGPVFGVIFLRNVPATLYFLPVVISGAFGGLGPGLLAVLVSAPLALLQYADSARTNPVLASPTQFDLRVGLFLALSVAIAWLSGRTRDAVTRSRQSAAQAMLDRQLLAGTRDQLSQLIQLNLIGVALLSLDGRVTDANNSFLQMTGKTTSDIAAGELNWKQLMPTSEASELLEIVIRDGICAPTETECKRADGSTLPALVRAARQGNTNQIVAFVVDLSDQRLAEAQLRHNRRLLERIAEATPDMLFVVKLSDLSVKFVNNSALDILGYSAAQILALGCDGWKQIVHPDDWAAIAAAAAKFDTEPDGKVLQVQCRMNKPNGETCLILLRGVAFERGPNGKCLEVLGLGQDVTEQVEAQSQLRESHKRLEAASRAKDQFLAALSHELRTPLNPVLGIVSMLENNPALSGPVKDDLRVVRRNVELEARLIDDLLDLTRITNGKLKLHREIIRAHEKVLNAVHICQDEINAKNIALDIRLLAPVHMLNADAARCQQVFWNLLKNAVKFTPAGGRVTIQSSNPDPDTWCIEVIDSGVGIHATMLPRIFEAFEQAGRQGQFGGLGLGLAISKTVVELHGGRIIASSPGPGRGATFRVEMPVTTEVPRAETPPQLPAQSAPGKLRILLVEDHADTARVMERVLSAMGHTVFTATCVHDAVGIINNTAYDLLISDIGLPDGTGLDVVRASRAHHQVPAIAVTGFGMDADIARTREAGFDAHVTKPVDIYRLSDLIDTVTKPAEVSA
jgi:PAS domain S-box-containing protein